tara:strand:- start:58 stop:429 length:372 start_codon:yes stop_codon:yes gene_type:complete
MPTLENHSHQGLHLTLGVKREKDERNELVWTKTVEIKLSRETSVRAVEDARKLYAEATPAQRQAMTDPASIIDPYIGETPRASIDLAKVAKDNEMEVPALMALLEKSATYRAYTKDGRLKVVK